MQNENLEGEAELGAMKGSLEAEVMRQEQELILLPLTCRNAASGPSCWEKASGPANRRL